MSESLPNVRSEKENTNTCCQEQIDKHEAKKMAKDTEKDTEFCEISDTSAMDKALEIVSNYTKQIKDFVEDDYEKMSPDSDELLESTNLNELNDKLENKENSTTVEEFSGESSSEKIDCVKNDTKTSISAPEAENVEQTKEEAPEVLNDDQYHNLEDELNDSSKSAQIETEPAVGNSIPLSVNRVSDINFNEQATELESQICHTSESSENTTSSIVFNYSPSSKTEGPTVTYHGARSSLSVAFDECKTIRSYRREKESRKVDEMDPDTVCGIGCFKPQWLQAYATPKVYLLLFSILGVLQGSYYTYLIGILTTIEKRFAFKSKTSGIIMMTDEITPLLLGIIVGYFGGRTHRPRVVAVGMMLSALCCFVSALPYFIYGEAQHLMASSIKVDAAMYCHDENNAEQCDDRDRSQTFTAVSCFILGSFLKGFGNLAYFAIGIAYMDDTAKKKNTPIYFAVSSTLRLLGPTLGFLMSSSFLKYYENPTGHPGYGPEDPRWIGAWWLGFILQGVLLLICSFPMLLFPKRLPKQRERAVSNTANFDQESFGQKFKGLYAALTRLRRNRVYMLFSLGSIFGIISGFGFFIMFTKFIENQFRLTASQASMVGGPPPLVAVILSTTIGGISIWKWKPSAKRLAAGIMAIEALAIFGFLILMLPSCKNYTMPGTTYIDGQLNLYNECNTACNCSTSAINPTCGSDGVSTYFSPCHAGCTTSSINNGTQVFQNCSCVHDSNGSFTNLETMDSGFCIEENCWEQMVIYMVLFVFLTIVSNCLRVGHQLILVRCIEPQDKSVALGLFETLVCAFAFIPYPLMYGALVDSACLVWESSCGESGNCWIYDMNRFKYLLHGTSAAFSAISAVCYLGVYFYADSIQDIYADDPMENIKLGESEEETKY